MFYGIFYRKHLVSVSETMFLTVCSNLIRNYSSFSVNVFSLQKRNKEVGKSLKKGVSYLFIQFKIVVSYIFHIKQYLC